MIKTKSQIKRAWRWWEKEDGTASDKLVKLEVAFAEGNNDDMACTFAEITLDQLYYYTRRINPAFQVRKEQLKVTPVLAANAVIVKAVSDYTDEQGNFHPADIETAKWYLERKRKKEFSLRSEFVRQDKNDFNMEDKDKIKLEAFLNGESINPKLFVQKP